MTSRAQEHPSLTFVQTLYRCRELGSGALARLAGAATLQAVKQGLAGEARRRQQRRVGARQRPWHCLQRLWTRRAALGLPLKLRAASPAGFERAANKPNPPSRAPARLPDEP